MKMQVSARQGRLPLSLLLGALESVLATTVLRLDSGVSSVIVSMSLFDVLIRTLYRI